MATDAAEGAASTTPPPAGLSRANNSSFGSNSSFRRRHARTVSYEELKQLGLDRALDEYYKMVDAAGGGGRERRPRRPPPAAARLLLATVARPLPRALSPEALFAAVRLLAAAAAWVVHSTAVVTVPLAVWFVAGCGGAPLAPPPRLAAALPPALRGAALPPAETPRQRCAVAAAVLAALLAAEAAVAAAARRRAAAAARAVTPARLDEMVAGCALPGPPAGHAPAAVTAADVTAAVNLVARQVWGASAPPLATLAEAAAAVARLGDEVGVPLPAESRADAARLMHSLDKLKVALGLPA